LGEAVRAADKRLAFLPHPNLQRILDTLPISPEVLPIRYGHDDIQRVLARTAVMVTDYSSMAFNAAFLGRPVVYFQFDAQSFFSGANASRPGYFDYARDGFGPLAPSVEEAVAAVGALLRDGPGEYAARMEERFAAIRDGRCCERTVTIIEELRRPPSPAATPEVAPPAHGTHRLAPTPAT
jgi:CDP-glycerol glycerophosphotransferase (TagB/SpsB family)